MNTLLIVVLTIGTLGVIFQKQIVDFLFRYCNFDKMMDLDRFFLSASEKRRKREMQQLLEKSPDELRLQTAQIVEKCGKKYNESLRLSASPEMMAKLPADVRLFFAAYDYLLINDDKILDVKKVEAVVIDGRRYYIIGESAEEKSVYMVADQSQTPENQKIYEQEYNIGPDQSRDIIFIGQSCYASFHNFICFTAAYFAEE